MNWEEVIKIRKETRGIHYGIPPKPFRSKKQEVELERRRNGGKY